ncbi:hypothetical protein HOY80DRAFT_534064 [Tuber brumale]|nr:hypothetical protein HOY80DRAFT_534064 [Tuber brumale]
MAAPPPAPPPDETILSTSSIFFSFSPAPLPGIFSFTSPPPAATTVSSSYSSSSYPRKRARPLADIDGLDGDFRDYNKKRRLRLILITSRLSEPFAVPPTNILDRGNCSRVALWAKTRAVSRNVLRKAAILNKIKRDAMAARAAQERQVEIARQQFREKIAAAAQSSPKRNHVAQFHPPLDQGAYIVKPRKTKGLKSTQHSKKNHKSDLPSTPDPYGIPKHRRPPTPPSESELDWQRRGMGLGI